MDLSSLVGPAACAFIVGSVATVLTVDKVCERISEWIEAYREVRERPFIDGYNDVLTPKQFQLELGDPLTGKQNGTYKVIHSHDVKGYFVYEAGESLTLVRVDVEQEGTLTPYDLSETGSQDFLDWIGNERYSSLS